MNLRHFFAVLAFVLSMTFGGHSQAQGYDAPFPVDEQAEEITSESEAITPGNRQLFTPVKRTLATAPGVQDVLAIGCLAAFIILGLFQLRNRTALSGSALMLAASVLFYSAWVFHKWTINGYFVVLYGHLICLAVAAIAIWLGCMSAGLLLKEKSVEASKTTSSAWLLPGAAVLSLGLATGTAAIFEAGPQIFGIDAALHQIALMVIAGSAGTTGALVFFLRLYRKTM